MLTRVGHNRPDAADIQGNKEDDLSLKRILLEMYNPFRPLLYMLLSFLRKLLEFVKRTSGFQMELLIFCFFNSLFSSRKNV